MQLVEELEASPGSEQDSHHSLIPPSQRDSQWSMLRGLFLKSLTLQSRNWCSNLCQIVTPVLCLLFTLAVRQIVGGITTGAVWQGSFPQPFNQPILDSQIRPQLGLACTQLYYYQHPNLPTAEALMHMQLSEVCPDGSLSPRFSRVESVNKEVMACLQRADVLNFERGDDLNTDIPDGIVSFKNASNKSLAVALGINDFRLPEYHKNNGVTKIVVKTSTTSTISTYLRVTEGLLSLVQRLTRPFLMRTHPKEVIAGSFQYMPFSGEDKSLLNRMVNVLGSGLYPLGLSLLLPVLLYLLVSEREERQLEMMKMNGLEMRCYWVNFFVVSLFMGLAASLFMFVIGRYVIEVTFFVSTGGMLLWSVFLGWAIAQVSLAALVQVFIDSAKAATIVGYILSIFSTLVGVAISTVIFPSPMTLPLLLVLYPPFALSRIVFHLGVACADSRECYRSFAGIDPELSLCITMLYAWLLMFPLAVWLNGVIQQEYGVSHPPAWLAVVLKWFRKRTEPSQWVEQQSEGRSDINSFQIEMQGLSVSRGQMIDPSVAAHAQTVTSSAQHLPLTIRALSKQYSGDNGEPGKVALKPLTLGLKRGEIFGFLGPNGAGKTTLISVLTGMYPATSGAAWIGGLPVGQSATNRQIGVCPQFDILWRELTVEEHLLFYMRLKGIASSALARSLKEGLEEVDLFEHRHLRAGELSGGMQRRLSIAIALVGSPSVVFLDEPSSGLDPFHRRQIWQILQRCKHRTSIFLTSHMMDEVQYLCERIGVISQGQLRCIGSLRELKERFGQGYKLVISFPQVLREGGGRPQAVQQLVLEWGLQVVGELETRVVLRIKKEQIPPIASLLRQQEHLLWSIEQPSLYDVFTHFVK